VACGARDAYQAEEDDGEDGGDHAGLHDAMLPAGGGVAGGDGGVGFGGEGARGEGELEGVLGGTGGDAA